MDHVDGPWLLLLPEIKAEYLGKHSNTYNVLAALSTFTTMRYTDCEVLKFAGGTCWKLVAMAYQYFIYLASKSSSPSNRVCNITNNFPLAHGMRECEAAAYVMHNPAISVYDFIRSFWSPPRKDQERTKEHLCAAYMAAPSTETLIQADRLPTSSFQTTPGKDDREVRLFTMHTRALKR